MKTIAWKDLKHKSSPERCTEIDRQALADFRRMVRASEPEVLRVIGEEAVRNGTSTRISRQIETIVRATRADRMKRLKMP